MPFTSIRSKNASRALILAIPTLLVGCGKDGPNAEGPPIAATPRAAPPAAEEQSNPAQKREQVRRQLEGRFVPDPDIERLSGLLGEKKYQQVIEQASGLLEEADKRFPSPRKARMHRAMVYRERGSARVSLGQPLEAVRDFRAAMALGMRDAAYDLGKLLEAAASQAPVATDGSLLREEAIVPYTMAAELGDNRAMTRLKELYRGKRKSGSGNQDTLMDLENYWGLCSYLRCYGEGAQDRIAAFVSTTKQIFGTGEITLLRRAVEKRATSWRSTRDAPLPGRSWLTCAYVDTFMARQLEFVWWATFDDSTVESDKANVRDVFEYFRDSLPKTPFGEVYLVVASQYSGSLPDAIRLERPAIGNALMPCDDLVLLNRDNMHYATLWDIDPKAGTALILDPFPEFWDPAQNSAISTSEMVDYKHSRQLVKVRLPDLLNCLVAFFAIRDRTRE